jgi:hypothetical protein
MAPTKTKGNSVAILAELATISAKLSKLDPVPENLKPWNLFLPNSPGKMLFSSRRSASRTEQHVCTTA